MLHVRGLLSLRFSFVSKRWVVNEHKLQTSTYAFFADFKFHSFHHGWHWGYERYGRYLTLYSVIQKNKMWDKAPFHITQYKLKQSTLTHWDWKKKERNDKKTRWSYNTVPHNTKPCHNTPDHTIPYQVIHTIEWYWGLSGIAVIKVFFFFAKLLHWSTKLFQVTLKKDMQQQTRVLAEVIIELKVESFPLLFVRCVLCFSLQKTNSTSTSEKLFLTENSNSKFNC